MAKRWLSSSSKPFDKILIANRGEIVSRVVRTCNALGIDTVAVFSTADAKAPFVRDATEAYCIGPAASSESYLNVDAVMKVMKETGAQAVHPGYGFLSESSAFANLVASHDATWLGPSPHAIDALGDKINSKNLALKAGVNVIPGYEGELESLEQAVSVANDIGYPVLLKASAGGGGKGMRVCRSDTDMVENFSLAKSEALNFFSDDRLLVEKYVENPHHIEFQVLAGRSPDGELDVCVFVERECSIQRRHQKILEESPSPLLKEETRLAMVQQVKKLVHEVGYTSAGTVEWLVDEEQNFYFLEMNTRLQVEHPVTELVSNNVDLVKGMLWVGAGWGLPPEILETLGDKPYFPSQGYAMEARLYAEDPLRGFLPSTGPLIPYHEPTNARVDSGVKPGHIVTPHYDPMLSKVIAHDHHSRLAAIDKLIHAMEDYVVGPSIQHNGRLVQDVLRKPAFREGNTPTSFLTTHYPDGFQGVELTPKEQHELAACIATFASNREAGVVVVRLGGMFGDAFQVVPQDACYVIATLPEKEFCSTLRVEQKGPIANYLARFDVDGQSKTVQVLSQEVTGEYKVEMHGANMDVLVQSPREYELSLYMHPPKHVDTSDMVLSPMPGTLIRVAVKAGDCVEVGQELCIVEAMKMQNIIRSPRAGTIAHVRVDAGASLMADQVIIDLEPSDDENMAA